MLGDDEIKDMNDEIRHMEEELLMKKRKLNEARYSGLRAAMEARKLADKEIAAELKKLGYRFYSNFSF